MDILQVSDDVELLVKDCWSNVISQYFNALSDGQVITKAHDKDFQTIADIESEKFLTSELKKLIPGSLVLGEEAEASGAVSLDIFEQAPSDEYVWVIDPIDGTYNFVNGHINFAIIVGLVKNNETVGGWIYRPLTNELVSATKGNGAKLNGVTTTVSDRAEVGDLNGYSPIIYTSRTPYKDHFKAAAKELGGLDNLQSAGVHYLNMVAGDADFYVVHHSKPWDHAAGTFIFQEAGGITTQWDGSPYRPSDNKALLISANNQKSYDLLQDKFIKPVYP